MFNIKTRHRNDTIAQPNQRISEQHLPWRARHRARRCTAAGCQRQLSAPQPSPWPRRSSPLPLRRSRGRQSHLGGMEGGAVASWLWKGMQAGRPALAYSLLLSGWSVSGSSEAAEPAAVRLAPWRRPPHTSRCRRCGCLPAGSAITVTASRHVAAAVPRPRVESARTINAIWLLHFWCVIPSGELNVKVYRATDRR